MMQIEAQKLVIRMVQGGRRILELDVPARSICWLSRIIPEILREILSGAGVDFAALEARYRSGPIRQGSVLALAVPAEDREVLIYLV